MAAPKDDSFKMSQFGGMLPAWDDHLLPDGQAASSTNGYLFSGALESWRVPKALHTFADQPGFVYRLPQEGSATAGATLWFLLNASEGDLVTVGEEIYKFTATVKNPNDVLIGIGAAVTAQNFYDALTFDNGLGTNQGILYGNGTFANPAIDQTSPQTKNTVATDQPRITVVAPDVGSAYNGTLVSSSDTNLAWRDTQSNTAVTGFTNGQNVSLATDITGASTWLEFADQFTDVIRSPIVDDQYDRYYMASSSLAPRYNTRKRIEAGEAPWLLGVPPPGCSPTVSVSGGGQSATLGNNTSTSVNTGTPGANTIYLIPVTPTGAEILNDVTAVCQTTSTTAKYAAVLYEDNNGTPGTLLNVGQVETGTSAGQNIQSAFVNPTGLLMNVQYWIGIMSDTALAFQLADDTGSAGVVSLNTFTNGPPATITNLSTGYPDLQLWGDMTSSAVQEARSYVYTYLTEYGEESPPSPATVLTGWSNGTWTIGLFQPPADQLGVTRDIKYLRIYRTVTATGGTTTYFQVTGTTASSTLTDLPATQGTYVDTITDDVVVTNNQLQSQLWYPPPEGLQGMVVMPNGVIAGWKSNEIWFCEPYRPHAWPPSYVLTTEYPIVGLGVSGNSVVAATSGAPYVATGVAPASMTATRIDNSEPCHSRKSILGSPDGVYYASRNGLMLVNANSGQVTNITEDWIKREDWQALTPQANLAAVFLLGQYYAWEIAPNQPHSGSIGNRGFTVELSASDADSFSIWPQPGRHRQGFQLLSNPLTQPITMVAIDKWSSVCTLIAGNTVYQLDFTDLSPTLSVLDWTSKEYQQRTKKSFEAMRILFEVPPGTPAQNPTRLTNATNDPIWTSGLPPDRYGFILVYAAGQLVTAREIRTDQEVLRILSGFKHETWQWRIISRVKISTIQIGTTVKGMANV